LLFHHDLPILCFLPWLGWRPLFSVESHECFGSGWSRTLILLILASGVDWNGRHVGPYPAIGKDGVSQTISWRWPWMAIFLISASQVAKITGVNPRAWLPWNFLWPSLQRVLCGPLTELTSWLEN
jgi:hypothetical protein